MCRKSSKLGDMAAVFIDADRQVLPTSIQLPEESDRGIGE